MPDFGGRSHTQLFFGSVPARLREEHNKEKPCDDAEAGSYVVDPPPVVNRGNVRRDNPQSSDNNPLARHDGGHGVVSLMNEHHVLEDQGYQCFDSSSAEALFVGIGVNNAFDHWR